MEKFKTVLIKDREYRIGKFGARDGSFILLKVAGILAPIVEALMSSGKIKEITAAESFEDFKLGDFEISKLVAPLTQMAEADFKYLQAKCLGVCGVKVASGYVPILNDTGEFSQPEMDDDVATAMFLMVHTLMHNLMGFFVGSPLSGLLGGILSTK